MRMHGVCRGFSRGYLRHLFMSEEMLGPVLVSLHNIAHFQALMMDLRVCISRDDWSGLEARWPVVTRPPRGSAVGGRDTLPEPDVATEHVDADPASD